MGVGYEKAHIIQMGKQSTFDSAAAATFKYPGLLEFNEEIGIYLPKYPQGVRAVGVSGQQVAVQKGFNGVYTSELTFEEITLFAASCLKGGVSPSGAMADKTWTYTPPPAADPALTYITLEYGNTDYSTEWTRQAPNVIVPQMEIAFASTGEGVSTFKAMLEGGAVTSGFTKTSSLAVRTRELVKGALWKLYIDDAFGSLGGTLFTGNLVSGQIIMNGGVRRDYTCEGRSNLDYGKYLFGAATIDINLILQYNGTADTEIGKWRSLSTRYVRLRNTGSTLGASNRQITVDAVCEYFDAMKLGTSNGNDTVAVKLSGRYNATAAYVYSLVLVNALTSLT